MVSTEQQGALGNAHVAADDDLVKVVNPSLFPDPNMVSHFKFPRILNGYSGLDDQSASDACAEQTEQSPFQSRRPRKPSLEEESAYQCPQNASYDAPWIVSGIVEQIEASRDKLWHQFKGRLMTETFLTHVKRILKRNCK